MNDFRVLNILKNNNPRGLDLFYGLETIQNL